MAYVDDRGPIALAHRGGGVLAPENTLAAFARSTALGLRHLETDVRLTADGHLVCFHDAVLDRVTNGTGPVAARTLAQLRRLRVGGTDAIPTLGEALEAFPEARFSVDLKEAEAIGPLVQVLGRPGVAERVCVAGAWDGWIAAVRREVPTVATALGWRSLTLLIGCSRAGVRPPRWVASAPFAHVPIKLGRVPIFVEEVVHLAHDLGVRIVTWTVDDPAQMHALLDAGVDAVITDRPDVLREVLLERGQWQPATPQVGRADRSGPAPSLRAPGEWVYA